MSQCFHLIDAISLQIRMQRFQTKDKVSARIVSNVYYYWELEDGKNCW